MISDIDVLLKKVDNTAELLYMNRLQEADLNLAEVFPEIRSIYLDIINLGMDNNRTMTEIPVEILLSQLKNLIEAYDAKDIIMLADTLRYEIKEGLHFCKEISDSENQE